MPHEPFKETVIGWQQLAESFEANAEDFAYLEGHRTRLVALAGRAFELAMQQAALAVRKQEVTREIEGVLEEGRRLATLLRVGVRQQYGPRSEKLLAFNLKPFRGRRRKTRVEPTPTDVSATPTASDP